MTRRTKSNEMRFSGIVFKEIVRFSRARGIDSIGILKMNSLIDTCVSTASDPHKGIINLEQVGQIIREELTA